MARRKRMKSRRPSFAAGLVAGLSLVSLAGDRGVKPLTTEELGTYLSDATADGIIPERGRSDFGRWSFWYIPQGPHRMHHFQSKEVAPIETVQDLYSTDVRR